MRHAGLRSFVMLQVLGLAPLSGTALAAAVTFQVAARGGEAVANTVLVADPLDGTAAPAHGTASIDQINKQFVPRVSVIRTGTAVSFPNSDHIRHQVYSFSAAQRFTLKLYAGSPSAPVVFDKPGLVVLGCNIHDKMSAFVAVVDSPYFTLSDSSGAAALKLPPGRYRLRIWHQNLASAAAQQEITVRDAPLAIALTLDLHASDGIVAPWPD